MKFRNKRIGDLVVAAVQQGWKVRAGGDGHIHLFAPDGHTRVTLSMTKNDKMHGYQNARAALRRAGLKDI